MTIRAFLLDDDVTYLSILRDLLKQEQVTDCQFYTEPQKLLKDITEEDYIYVLDYGNEVLQVLVQILSVNPDALVIILVMNETDLEHHGAWRCHSKADELAALLDTIKDVKFTQQVLKSTVQKREIAKWLKTISKHSC